MDKLSEIAKFQALMQLAVVREVDLTNEIRFQTGVLVSLGVDVNNQIHDRHVRKSIPISQAEWALSSVRNAARLVNLPLRKPTPLSYEKPVPSRDEVTAAYLRASGKEARKLPSDWMAQRDEYNVAAGKPARHGSDLVPLNMLAEVLAPANRGSIRVPYGINNDSDIVHARDATKATAYTCPGCEAPLVLHAGEQRTHHFSHQADNACDGETLIHITAKLLAAKVVRENNTAVARIRLQCKCSKCNATLEKVLPKNAFTASVVEARVGKFTCDVAAFKGNDAILAIEILNTHAVDDIKGAALGLPWVELRASDVLDDPYYWRPTQDGLKPTLCTTCKAAQATLEQVANRWELPLGQPQYVGAVASCWACHETIIWYWWLGIPFAENLPPEPKPQTIQLRFSKMYGGKYWMNTCPGCRAPQGDNFVFLSSESPLHHLPINDAGPIKEHRQKRNADLADLFKTIVRRNI